MQRKQLLLVITIAFGILLNPLNSSMISVALVSLQQDFSLSFSHVSWLISTYYLASAVGQPVMGKLGDVYGRKRLFFAGLILVAVASMLAPFSPNFIVLLAFRILQAIGSSVLFPSGMAIIRKSITKNQAQALAILSVFSSVSAAFGPSIGGFLIHIGDWPMIFLINFPFILISLSLAIKVLPNDEPSSVGKVKIDWVGVFLFTGMIVSWLLLFLSIDTMKGLIYVVPSIGFTWLFYRWERRQVDPFINIHMILGNKKVSFVYIQFILINIIFYSIFFGVPTYLQQARHLDTKTVGLIMLSIAGFGVVTAPLAGRWIDRSGSRPALLFAAVMLISGLGLMLTIRDGSSLTWIFITLSVLGFSNSFSNLGLQTTLYASVSEQETGTASGLFMTSRYMGTIFSSSMLGLVFQSTVSTKQFMILILSLIPLSFIILGLAWQIPRNRVQRNH